jgi:hypothetical protein
MRLQACAQQEVAHSMNSIWQDKTLTIVVFPGDDAKAVNEVLKSWTKDKLLNYFLTVVPQDIELFSDQPAKVNAAVYGLNNLGEVQDVKVDLFQELARNEFDVVRLIAVRVLRGGNSEAENFAALLNELAKYVENSLPLASSRNDTNAKRTKLYKLNLVVAPTEDHKDHYKNAILDSWNLNVIASPEDRSTPWSGDAFVRDDQKLPRFIGMHLATIGGLWNGATAGPFEMIQRENSQQGSIWVSRVFVNSVLTDGLSRRVAARALQAIGDPDSDVSDPLVGIEIPGTVLIPESESDSWVDWMVEVTFNLDNKALMFSNPLEEDAPEKERWFEWHQIKSFIVFSWDKVKVIPWWIWIWFRRLIGRLLTSVFQGKSGQAIVGAAQEDPMDSRDRLVKDKIESISSLNDQARRALATPQLSSLTKTNPTLWNGIRKLVFSMLDASNRKDFGVIEDGSRIPVFSRVNLVISDPKKTWVVESKFVDKLEVTEITWKNQEKLPDLLNEFELHKQEIQAKRNILIDQLLDIDIQMATLPTDADKEIDLASISEQA